MAVFIVFIFSTQDGFTNFTVDWEETMDQNDRKKQ
jgi:hypothetical protein